MRLRFPCSDGDEEVGEEAFARLVRVLNGEMTGNETIKYYNSIDIYTPGPVI